ncbi:nucleoside-diphosphate sugar epimerase [Tenacibaculum aestuariivivum]|uniref:nucleoside-diphosphate sugar epimerase n=1 Tax=Tenacibaculum aestuariivivum TaxID=2006131 RepID=UPI003AB599A8
MKKTAIILGATGLTGNHILHKLIKDDTYKSIKLFSRSKIEGLPNKVTQFIGNLLELNQFKKKFIADEVYCCIGTTAKKTPDKNSYKNIDYGIPVNAAILSKENNIPTFLVISAMGANIKSNIFYNRIKGEMEHDVLTQKIKNTFIFRPALIGGKREEHRFFEKLGLVIFTLIQPIFIGKLKKYKIIDAQNIAQAMLYVANNTNSTEVIITSNKIKKLSLK